MENENKSAWGKILKVIITVLTAVATTFGLQACMYSYEQRDITQQPVPELPAHRPDCDPL